MTIILPITGRVEHRESQYSYRESLLTDVIVVKKRQRDYNALAFSANNLPLYKQDLAQEGA